MAEHEPEGENQSEWHQAVEQAFEALNLTRSATKEDHQLQYAILGDRNTLLALVTLALSNLQQLPCMGSANMHSLYQIICSDLGVPEDNELPDILGGGRQLVDIIDPLAEGIWASRQWATVLVVQRALAGALLGSPLPKAAQRQDSINTAFIAAALMMASCDVVVYFFCQWLAQLEEGPSTLPRHLLQVLTNSLVYLHTSMPYTAGLPGNRGYMLASLCFEMISFCVSIPWKQLCRVLSSHPSSVQSPRPPANQGAQMTGRSAAGSPQQAQRNTTKKGGGRSRVANSIRPDTNIQQGAAMQVDPVAQQVGEIKGILMACFKALQRAIAYKSTQGPLDAGPVLPTVLKVASEVLDSGLWRQDTPHKLWPSDIAMTAKSLIQSALCWDGLQPTESGHMSTEHVLSSMLCIDALTRLAQAMARQGEDPAVLSVLGSYSKNDEPAVRSWYATCGALCGAATTVLETIDVLASQAVGCSFVQWRPPTQDGTQLVAAQQSMPTNEAIHQGQQSPPEWQPHAHEIQGIASLESDTVALMPWLGAAGLMLAHAALAVARITATAAVPTLPTGLKLGVSRAAIDVAGAGSAALTLYSVLLRVASCQPMLDQMAEDMRTPSTSAGISKRCQLSSSESQASSATKQMASNATKGTLSTTDVEVVVMPSTACEDQPLAPGADATSAALGGVSRERHGPPATDHIASSEQGTQGTCSGTGQRNARRITDVKPSEICHLDVSRYALAIATWAGNLPCLMQWLHPVTALYTGYDRIGCATMASWEAVPCTMSCSTLLRHLSSIAKAGSDAMATAHGDLLGWLGDLAPSGSLTSTELLYRTYGVSTFVEGLPVPSCLEPYRSALVRVHTELMALLSLAWQVASSQSQRQDVQHSQGPASATTGRGGSNGPAVTSAELQAAFRGSPVTVLSLVGASRVDHFSVSMRQQVQHALEKAGIAGVEEAFSRSLEKGRALGNGNPEVYDRLLRTAKPEEPLYKLMRKERHIWARAWRVQAKEEGYDAHVQLLEEFVQAAAQKAAGQLHSEVAQGLQQALG